MVPVSVLGLVPVPEPVLELVPEPALELVLVPEPHRRRASLPLTPEQMLRKCLFVSLTYLLVFDTSRDNVATRFSEINHPLCFNIMYCIYRGFCLMSGIASADCIFCRLSHQERISSRLRTVYFSS